MASVKLQLQFLFIVLAVALILSFLVISPFLTPLVLAAVCAVVLQPLYRAMLRSTGNRKGVSAGATVLFSFVCILIPLAFLGSQVFHESTQLYNSIAQGDNTQNLIVGAIRSIGNTYEHILPGTGEFFIHLSDNLDVYVQQGLVWLTGHLGAALSGISVLVLNLLIFFISLYYLLCDGPKLKQALISLSPLDDKDDRVVFDRLELAVNSVMKGSLMIAGIQGVLTAVGFAIFGVPNSILWGTVTVVAAFIPAIGTALVLIPGIIYLFVVGNTAAAIGLLVWGVLAVGLVDNILVPKLVGRGMQMHPLLVLLSVLGGIAYFGPIGVFLGPLCISLLFAFITIYSYLANSVPLTEQNVRVS
ncbi:MAG: AI-2E family transporter [bacterium]|nr:AI-2E family transporter [bacterium]